MRPLVRRKPHYFWVRSVENNVTPVQGPSVNTQDLLSVFRTKYGNATFNFPDICLWRLIIRISINFKFSVATPTANTGVLLAVFVESEQLAVLDPSTHPYDFQYLMWDEAYVSEEAEQGGLNLGTVDTTTPHNLHKRFDIKAHRKFRSIDDITWLTLTGTGNMSITDYAIQQSALYRVP